MNSRFGLNADVLRELHTDALARYGGSEGVRDVPALDGLVGNAYNSAQYAVDGDEVDALTFAAYIAQKVALSHAFVDGNKRVAWSALVAVLLNKGYVLEADEKEAAQAILDLVEHRMSVEDLSGWIAGHLSDNAEIPCD